MVARLQVTISLMFSCSAFMNNTHSPNHPSYFFKILDLNLENTVFSKFRSRILKIPMFNLFYVVISMLIESRINAVSIFKTSSDVTCVNSGDVSSFMLNNRHIMTK